ncbi:leucine-rich repeat-containing protein 75A [Heptranchias perlo]|uniref:leucine-rich repeat-containing protein 75A n=1 Tax=Heptranchias perlo TaxID=212740 RepID=UPI0035596192
MGGKQTKGRQPSGSAESPQRSLGCKKKTPGLERGDFLSSFVLKSGDRYGKSPIPPPYQKRIAVIQDMVTLAKQGRQEEATDLLRSLRQDLGMESTSLDDVLCRYASFRNLVDPITHDLIISLARYIHCPKPDGDSVRGMEKVCRQLTYHLSPHSQWRRPGLMKRKPHACLKAALSGTPTNETVDLSGIALTSKDIDRAVLYLQQNQEQVCSLELCFTELTDEGFLQLLPTLYSLPHLNTLSLNGNRLTRSILRDLTETLKDLERFPSITWIDLGNNVDIFSLPQPFLVSLRRRCPKQGNLPTILEFGEGQGSELENSDTDPSEGPGEGMGSPQEVMPHPPSQANAPTTCDASEGDEGVECEADSLPNQT